MAVHDEAGLYVRQATGLVRAAGKWSVLVYNIMFVSIGLMTLFALSLIPAFYPGANIQLTFVLALVVVLPTSMVFAMLSSVMPRSGGDYVFVSRALHPGAGWLLAFSQGMWLIFFWIGFNAWFALDFAAPTAMVTIGTVTGSQGWITAANDLLAKYDFLGIHMQWLVF